MRVSGISGIDKHYDYLRGYGEELPYINDRDGLRSIYHIRQFDVQKLKMVLEFQLITDFIVSRTDRYLCES